MRFGLLWKALRYSCGTKWCLPLAIRDDTQVRLTILPFSGGRERESSD